MTNTPRSVKQTPKNNLRQLKTAPSFPHSWHVLYAFLEAKSQAGVYVVGELLNVDGMTGGFNFQHCWSSANAVALAISEAVAHA